MNSSLKSFHTFFPDGCRRNFSNLILVLNSHVKPSLLEREQLPFHYCTHKQYIVDTSYHGIMVLILRRNHLLARHLTWIRFLGLVEAMSAMLLKMGAKNLKDALFVFRTIFWGAWAAMLTRKLCCNFRCLSLNEIHCQNTPPVRGFAAFSGVLHRCCHLSVGFCRSFLFQYVSMLFIPSFRQYLDWFASFSEGDRDAGRHETTSLPPSPFVMERGINIFGSAENEISYTSKNKKA